MLLGAAKPYRLRRDLMADVYREHTDRLFE